MMFNRSQIIYLLLASIFLTSLIIANLVGSMLFSFNLPFDPSGWPALGSLMTDKVLLSAGIIPFPITFLLTDLLNEFYGKRGALLVTAMGFAMSILTFTFLWIGEQLPVDPISQLTHAQYLHVSQLYTGMFVASLIAYVVGQLLDIYVFHLFRTITKHRLLWVRATGSTLISQLFDSVLVTFIAFWGVHSVETLTQLALGNYIWKFVIAVAITPLLYAGHAILNRLIRWQEDITERLDPEYTRAS